MKMNIGLLGGTFNPAHDGHIHISNIALRSLKLDEVWWIVTPQNPLKLSNDKDNIHTRVKNAKLFVKNNRIRVGAPEIKLRTNYTYDTLLRLNKSIPNVNFIWLIGADNMIIMHKWYRWRKIFFLNPIVVIDRPNYFRQAITSKASRYFWRRKINNKNITNISNYSLPAWGYIRTKLNSSSSTKIRK